MKASRILAGLSALSIAASMLSMVAAADDDLATTAPNAADDGAAYGIAGEDPDPEGEDVTEVATENETTGTAADADRRGFGFPSTYPQWNFNTASSWMGTRAYMPVAATGMFAGWPGWGVSSFPTYWELYEDYLKVKDSAWEVWGIKNDRTIPGYIVFEYEDGKNYVIPVTVDENKQFSTDDIPMFRMGVKKIYFLFEVSDAPQFDLKLDKFTVNGTDVPLADNLKGDKYDKNGNPYIQKQKANGTDALEDGYGWTLNGEMKKVSTAPSATNAVTIPETMGAIGATFVGLDDDGNPLYDAVVEDGIVEDIPVFFKATIYDVDNLNPNDFDDDYKFDKDKKYGATDNLYDNNHDEPAINHKLFLAGTKVKITFTVSGIGKEYIPVDHPNGGDNEGKDHAEVKPDAAGGVDVTTGQKKNLALGMTPVNPKFDESGANAEYPTCSRDLYDDLVSVWNTSPDHDVDAEITFKTVSDKNGVLVANFIDVWELDVDGDGNAAHWLKDFKDGFAYYVKQVDAKVEDYEKKYSSWTYYQGVQLKDANGNLVFEDADKKIPKWETEEINGVVYYKCTKVTVQGSSDLSDWGQKEGDAVVTEITETVTDPATGEVKNTDKKHLVMDVKPIEISFKKESAEYKVYKGTKDAKVWAWDMDFYVVLTDAQYNSLSDVVKAKVEIDDDGDRVLNLKGFAVDKDNDHSWIKIPVGKDGDKWIYADGAEFLKDDKVEEAYCWHPYFLTENGLVDVVTKNYLGEYKTNVINYNNLTDAKIKDLSEHNGIYYNDNIHNAAYGHFVVFGDNTLREYSYRIKAEAIGQILNSVQRSIVAREEYIYKHGAIDLYAWDRERDSVKFGPNGELIMETADGTYKKDHAVGFDKDLESWQYYNKNGEALSALDKQMGKDGHADGKQKKDGGPAHRRAVHGSIWLQCCEGTYLKDVAVKAHTDIITQGSIPTLYGKENYDAMYPKKPVDSSSTASGAAAQPTAAEGAADANANSGAAAGFGIAGLLLAGAAMVCAKKKS